MYFNFKLFSDVATRPSGIAETVLHRVMIETQQTYVVQALKVKLKSNQMIDSEHIKTGLTYLQRKNAALKVYMEERDGKLWFVPFPSNEAGELHVPYEEVFAENWIGEMEKMSLETDRETFDSRLLWRVRRVHIKDKTDLIVLFQMHHSIMDGLSMCRVITDFVDIVSILADGRIPRIQDSRRPRGLLHSCEYYINETHLIPFMARIMFFLLNLVPSELISTCFTQLVLVPQKDKEAAKDQEIILNSFDWQPEDSTPKTGLVPFYISKKQTPNILSKMKLREVSMYGFMAAASRIVLEEMFEENSGVSVQELKSNPFDRTHTTVSLRRYFNGKVPDDYLGSYFSVVLQEISKVDRQGDPDKTFWDTARKYTSDIHSTLNNKRFLLEAIAYVSVADALGRYRKLYQRLVFNPSLCKNIIHSFMKINNFLLLHRSKENDKNDGKHKNTNEIFRDQQLWQM